MSNTAAGIAINFCGGCGHRFEEVGRFCGRCGASRALPVAPKVNAAPSSITMTKQANGKSIRNRAIAAVAIGVGVLAVGWGLFLGQGFGAGAAEGTGLDPTSNLELLGSADNGHEEAVTDQPTPDPQNLANLLNGTTWFGQHAAWEFGPEGQLNLTRGWSSDERTGEWSTDWGTETRSWALSNDDELLIGGAALFHNFGAPCSAPTVRLMRSDELFFPSWAPDFFDGDVLYLNAQCEGFNYFNEWERSERSWVLSRQTAPANPSYVGLWANTQGETMQLRADGSGTHNFSGASESFTWRVGSNGVPEAIESWSGQWGSSLGDGFCSTGPFSAISGNQFMLSCGAGESDWMEVWTRVSDDPGGAAATSAAPERLETWEAWGEVPMRTGHHQYNERLQTIPEGGIVSNLREVVNAGPDSCDGHDWWRVTHQGVEGWVCSFWLHSR